MLFRSMESFSFFSFRFKVRKKSGFKKGNKLHKTRGGKNSRREKFGEGFKEREKSETKKGKRLHKTREGKSLEKNLRNMKNRKLKKEKDSIKLEQGKT